MIEWSTIPRFPHYRISTDGDIMSYKSRNGRGGPTLVGRYLNPRKVKGKKYFQLALTDTTGTKIFRKVHLLVLECFVGPCPLNMEGCHNDGDASNNKLSNLRWDTHANNIKDQELHGTRLKGNASPRSILTEVQVREVKAMIPIWGRNTTAQFAAKFGVTWSAINSIRIGRTWSHL